MGSRIAVPRGELNTIPENPEFRALVDNHSAERETPTNIAAAAFDAHAPELVRSWSSFASTIVCINAYPNGITYSVHPGGTLVESEDGVERNVERYLPSQFHLRVQETREYMLPPGKYFLYKDNFAAELEKRLLKLREQRVLGSTVVYFGTATDPFSSFHKKFNVTMSCLELLEHYRPGRVVVQTRCPMVISALPVFKVLGENAVVAIPLESSVESVIQRYTPGQPRISDRLIAADGLRQQGVRVNLVASPILPYGDVHRDAWSFAELLESHADYISLGCLACGKPSDEAQLKSLGIAKRLVADKQYRWLRPHAYRNLYFALKVLAPDKLLLPVKPQGRAAQLSLFAA